MFGKNTKGQRRHALILLAAVVCIAVVFGTVICSLINQVDEMFHSRKSETKVFLVILSIALACFVMGLLDIFFCRRRVRKRSIVMAKLLYEAISDSIDMAVNLYAPSNGMVTPIVAQVLDIDGYSLNDLLHGDNLASRTGLSKDGAALFERIRIGAIREFEQGELCFDEAERGGVRWVSYSVRPLIFDGKRQLLIVLRDATSDKKIQLSMKDAMQAAEAANDAKSKFLPRMSHEIRTPMNVIIGMQQIALKSVDDAEKTRETLNKLGAASDHLLSLINDVLDISKIESGNMTLASEPFRLNRMILYVENVIRPQSEQKGQELNVVAPSYGDAVFVGDAMRIKQLLVNLLTNAVKYTPKGGHIRFETTVLDGPAMGYRQIVFEVVDDGIGMSREFLDHLFEPFTMEGRSHEQGTGLGMSIVKNIITLMGGDVEVDSAPNCGTKFRVSLNVRIAFEAERKVLEEEEGIFAEVEIRQGDDSCSNKANAAEGGSDLKSPTSGASSTRALDRGDLEGLHALVVEDNDLNAEITCELLSEAGLIVDRASDGQEACAMFEATAAGFYDVILMDVQMPVLDGYEATQHIRALDRDDASTVPIIAMSANAFLEDVNASLSSGMNAHLSKPIDMRRVLITIERLVRKRQEDGDG